MNVEFFTSPYKHAVVKDDTITGICKKLFNKCNYGTEIDISQMMVNNQEVHSGPVKDVLLETEDFKFLENVLEDLRINYFNTEIPKGKWSFNVTESNMSETAPELFPHSDDPVELYSEGATRPGFLKFLIYIADNDLQKGYKDYGTKIYTKINEDFKLVKEIPFVNGNMFIFETGVDSFHGTDFCSGRRNRRFFICGEYYINE